MDSKIRIGVLGAGWWGTSNHLPILKEREPDKSYIPTSPSDIL